MRNLLACFLALLSVSFLLALGSVVSSRGRLVVKQYSQPKQVCAPWITNRKVLFLDLATMNEYRNETNGQYKGGEFYQSACLDYALHQNGFEAEKMNRATLTGTDAVERVSSYHRVFFRGFVWSNRFNTTTTPWSDMCKVRAIHWWGNWKAPNSRHPFDPRQILIPFPQSNYFNTFLGFFPHSILFRTTPPPKDRQRVGLLLGKSAGYFKGHEGVIAALLANNFTLHTTCKDMPGNPCTFPPSVIRHDKAGPITFAKILPQFAFMIGFGGPIDSPSPFEGLANGVAFLNPIRNDSRAIPANETTFPLDKGPHWGSTQNNALAMMGMPYVYNIHLGHTSQVVAAANRAVRYRFSSHVPWEFQPEAMVSRVCTMLEDDALCLCPNPIGGDGKRGISNEDSDLDCRGSSVMRKNVN